MGIGDTFRRMFSGKSQLDLHREELTRLKDKIAMAEAANARPRNGAPDRRPAAVTAKAKHQGVVYNPAFPERNQLFETIYTPLEYDMASIANAIDTESIFRRSVEKYVELMWKNGFKFIGDNPNAVNYLKRRFEQIATVTEVPTQELFRQIAYQIVTYGNAFVAKVRKQKASGGKIRRTFDGKKLIPVAGYFVEDTVSMELAVKVNGDVIGYRQKLFGGGVSSAVIGGIRHDRMKIWGPSNMIHMFYSRKPGVRVGTPLVWPVLDDMRALRKMEQNVELLVFQHTVPLYHYRIGDEQARAQQEEIIAMKAEIESMPPNGAIVTPERHEIVAIGAEKKALDVGKYLEYFKKRVFSGLGMSAVGMGEGEAASRATADIMDKHLVNTTQAFQRVISMFVNECMIKEILAEGGYVWDAFDESNRVMLWFPPIDTSAQFERENHYAQMYAQHAIDEDELRAELGRDPVTEEQRDKMFFELVDKPKAIIGAVDEAFTEVSRELQKANAEKAKAAGRAVPKGDPVPRGKANKVKSNAIQAQRQGTNRDRPTNQFGRALARPRTPANPRGTDAVLDSVLSVYEATVQDAMESYTDYCAGDSYSMITLKALKNTVFRFTKDQIVDAMEVANTRGALDGYDQEMFAGILDNYLTDIYKKVEKVYDSKDINRGISRIRAIFDSSQVFITSLVENKVKQEDLVQDTEEEELNAEETTGQN